MKKFLSGILFLLISVFIFADSSASVEGVIEVAGKDELPAGYFGKAAGYLPGDSVSITNPNTGITLQILNLGTLDASGGIAILISEESAKSLGIERNSGVKVKLAPRSGYFDETVSGNAVLDEKTLPAAKEEPVSDVSAEPAVQAGPEAASQPAENAAVSVEPAAPVAVAGVPLIADTEDNAEEENAEVAAVEEEGEDENSAEETETESSEESNSEDEADFSDEEKLSAEPVEEEVSADDEPSVESVEEETEPVIVEAPAPTEECEVPEEPYEDYESVEDGFLESKEAVEQSSPAEESEVEAVTVEEPDPIEEETEDLPEEENAELVIVEEPQEEEPETPTEDETEEEAVTVEEPSPIEEDSAAEENQMEEVSEPEEVVAEPNAEPEAQSSGESESSDYAPIVLVPSEPESPEPPVDASIENEPIEIVPVESVPEEKKSEPEPLQTEYPVSIQDYVVSSESALASNCYYIQIATMGNIKNIENILVKYSKYPVSLIPAGKNYRVLVGPLSVDEYGAVLAKFKNAGFKDAFVRKR